MDYDEIEDGGELKKVIQSAICECTVFVVISSKAAIRSEYVAKEIDWASSEYSRRSNITILPIAIEPRSYHPKLEELNHVRLGEFICFGLAPL